ncbi:MAG: Uma2 family endonuclease [Planctomycetia bacterium]|nr:Uma2 family endonuclease [Planctomycetia bacterium]
MATTTSTSPTFKADASFRTFTVDEYDTMVQAGILTDTDEVELLEGYVVLKMPTHPPHDHALCVLTELFVLMQFSGWVVRGQNTAKLSGSRPEPDVALARGDRRTYTNRHPNPQDFGLVVEVSDSSLARDEQDKTRIYARDSIPVYWVVNLVDRRVEVFTDPTGPNPPAGAPGGSDPHYQTRNDYPAGTMVPVVLHGVTVGSIPVDELMP